MQFLHPGHPIVACESKDYYQILESHQFIPNDRDYHPYEGFVREYYSKKKELKDKGDPLHLPFKLLLNSVYGKAGETRLTSRGRVMGHFFNPVIFSHISGSTRAQVYRYVIENRLEKYVVFMATDSICTTCKLDKGSSALGEFARKDSTDDLFCIQNGINKWHGKWKERGIGNIKGKTIENPKIFERGNKAYMKLKIARVTNLRSAILQGKISEIGKFNEVTREINLNADR